MRDIEAGSTLMPRGPIEWVATVAMIRRLYLGLGRDAVDGVAGDNARGPLSELRLVTQVCLSNKNPVLSPPEDGVFVVAPGCQADSRPSTWRAIS